MKNKLLTYTQTQQIFPDFTQFENPIKIINGKLGKFNLKKPLRFYIESDLEEGNDIVLNSGLGDIYLDTQNLYLGRIDISGITSNLFFKSFDGQTMEQQSSAFTEILKTQIGTNTGAIINLETSDTLQNNNIQSLQFSDISQNILLSAHTNELEYLKLNDISQNNLLLSYGTQITNLQRSDISQNTLLLNLQSSDTLQNSYIQSLQFSDISQNNLLLSYGTQITNLQRSDISQNTVLLNLQSSDLLQNIL